MNIFWIIITLIVMTIGLFGTIVRHFQAYLIIYTSFLFYGFISEWKYYGVGAMIVWGIVTASLYFLTSISVLWERRNTVVQVRDFWRLRWRYCGCYIF